MQIDKQSPIPIYFIHQIGKRLAHRHSADAELFGVFPLRRKQRIRFQDEKAAGGD
jgi:hypothetical protein